MVEGEERRPGQREQTNRALQVRREGDVGEICDGMGAAEPRRQEVRAESWGLRQRDVCKPGGVRVSGGLREGQPGSGGLRCPGTRVGHLLYSPSQVSGEHLHSCHSHLHSPCPECSPLSPPSLYLLPSPSLRKLNHLWLSLSITFSWTSDFETVYFF